MARYRFKRLLQSGLFSFAGQLCVKCGYAVKLLPTAALMTLLMIGCHLVAQGLKKASE
ncbi:MAG: hypothetical protein IJM32_03500 [Ruminococcus sp.]|nr:hypothetical protein [Ruminococcus sp.]